MVLQHQHKPGATKYCIGAVKLAAPALTKAPNDENTLQRQACSRGGCCCLAEAQRCKPAASSLRYWQRNPEDKLIGWCIAYMCTPPPCTSQ
jgi:hypothetical protein